MAGKEPAEQFAGSKGMRDTIHNVAIDVLLSGDYPGDGKPKAVRAVGAANGRNPIGIIAPCHRVIGASGALTGFAGGLDAKRRLLALESAS